MGQAGGEGRGVTGPSYHRRVGRHRALETLSGLQHDAMVIQRRQPHIQQQRLCTRTQAARQQQQLRRRRGGADGFKIAGAPDAAGCCCCLMLLRGGTRRLTRPIAAASTAVDSCCREWSSSRGSDSCDAPTARCLYHQMNQTKGPKINAARIHPFASAILRRLVQKNTQARTRSANTTHAIMTASVTAGRYG